MRHSKTLECPTNICGEKPHASVIQGSHTKIVPACGELNASCTKSNNSVVRDGSAKDNVKRGIVPRHDRSTPCSYVWLMKKTKLVKSSHITFNLAQILDIVGKMKPAKLSNDEDERSE